MEARLTKAQEAMWAENDRLREQVRSTETEMRRLTDSMASSEEERVVRLTLELEKERGKLAGAWQSNLPYLIR